MWGLSGWGCDIASRELVRSTATLVTWTLCMVQSSQIQMNSFLQKLNNIYCNTKHKTIVKCTCNRYGINLMSGGKFKSWCLIKLTSRSDCFSLLADLPWSLNECCPLEQVPSEISLLLTLLNALRPASTVIGIAHILPGSLRCLPLVEGCGRVWWNGMYVAVVGAGGVW